MNAEIVASACRQYDQVLLPGEKMITEIKGVSDERSQKTTFEKKSNSSFYVIFEKPGHEPIHYTYPPINEVDRGF